LVVTVIEDWIEKTILSIRYFYSTNSINLGLYLLCGWCNDSGKQVVLFLVTHFTPGFSLVALTEKLLFSDEGGVGKR